MSSISFVDAFTSSPVAADAVAAPLDLESLQRALFAVSAPQCPLSARCCLEEGECVLEHVKRVHRVPECDVEVDANGVGVVEMEIDVPCRLQKRTQYSAMLLKFEGSVHLWSLESRLRADTETQVSAVVQIIKPAAADGNTPRSRASTVDGGSVTANGIDLSDISAMLASASSNSNSSSASCTPSEEPDTPTTPCTPKSFRVAVSIDVPSSPVTSPHHQHPSLLSPNFSSPATVPSTHPVSPKWSTTLTDVACSTPRRHERLVSHGQGLVALWPTQAHLFSSGTKPDMLQLAVRTTIERA